MKHYTNGYPIILSDSVGLKLYKKQEVTTFLYPQSQEGNQPFSNAVMYGKIAYFPRMNDGVLDQEDILTDEWLDEDLTGKYFYPEIHWNNHYLPDIVNFYKVSDVQPSRPTIVGVTSRRQFFENILKYELNSVTGQWELNPNPVSSAKLLRYRKQISASISSGEMPEILADTFKVLTYFISVNNFDTLPEAQKAILAPLLSLAPTQEHIVDLVGRFSKIKEGLDACESWYASLPAE